MKHWKLVLWIVVVVVVFWVLYTAWAVGGSVTGT